MSKMLSTNGVAVVQWGYLGERGGCLEVGVGARGVYCYEGVQWWSGRVVSGVPSRTPNARGLWHSVQQLNELALVGRDCSVQQWFRASASLSLITAMSENGDRRLTDRLRHLGRWLVLSLSFDLLTSPPRSLNRASLEVTIALGNLDECHDPVSTVVVGIVAIGEGVRQVTVMFSAQVLLQIGWLILTR